MLMFLSSYENKYPSIWIGGISSNSLHVYCLQKIHETILPKREKVSKPINNLLGITKTLFFGGAGGGGGGRFPASL